MTKIEHTQLSRTKMSVNPPKCVVDAGFKVIFDGNVFEYVGIGWLVVRDATPQDYETIPQVID